MVSLKQKAISSSVTTLGCVGTIVSCVLPVWRVTFPDDETNPDARIWEGLWHMCQVQGNRWIQCTQYNSKIPAAQDLNVSRGFMVVCITGTWLGLLLCMLGDWLIRCWTDRSVEDKIMKVASGMFLTFGLLMLVPLSWVTHNITPVLGYSKKVEMGISLYLAWTSSLLLLLGGILLCVNIPFCRAFPCCFENQQQSETNSSTSGKDLSSFFCLFVVFSNQGFSV